MEGNDLVVICQFAMNAQAILIHALIDCGALGIKYMDPDFTRHYQILL
jgi:hypothetical protein